MKRAARKKKPRPVPSIGQELDSLKAFCKDFESKYVPRWMTRGHMICRATDAKDLQELAGGTLAVCYIPTANNENDPHSHGHLFTVSTVDPRADEDDEHLLDDRAEQSLAEQLLAIAEERAVAYAAICGRIRDYIAAQEVQ